MYQILAQISWISTLKIFSAKKTQKITHKVLIRLLTIFLKIIQTLFKSKNNLILENFALRQQLSTYLRKRTKPKLTDLDRSFWIALKKVLGK